MANTTNPFNEWYETIQKMAGGNFPAMDFQSMTKAGQENMQAMNEVARIAASALQDIVKQQQSITTEAVAQWQETAGKFAKGDAQAIMTESVETFRSNAEKAAKHFGDLSEIARKAQTDIWSVLTTQTEKNMGKGK
jgi:phasin family protein